MGEFAARASSIALIGILAAVCSAQTGKVGKIALLSDEAVRQTLDPAGYRVSLDDGTTFCELWLRKSVPAQAKKDTADVVYPQLAESTLVGVLHFPKGGSDYRGALQTTLSKLPRPHGPADPRISDSGQFR